MEHDLLTGLTEAQREAVTHVAGPMLVLAGPGSGKTRVITHRVAYLIGQGVRPGHILAITFTNKAAQEMRERVHRLRAPYGATISTFHALAARLLREFAERAGLPANYSIYDDGDQRSVVREALKACQLDSQNFPPARVLSTISRWKTKFLYPEQLKVEDLDFVGERIARVYRAYQATLESNGALDFDDLLMRLALLLRDDTALQERLNERYRYVLVDEYQDTNHSQYQIARGLALGHSNICATGDPDQSIYGWRGADIGNILAFEEDYPEARIVRLEENFRSTPEVLAAADQVIRVNRQRKDKRLFTSQSSGPPCVLQEFSDERAEAAGVMAWIRQRREEGHAYRDLAVFYRVNSMSRVLEEALRGERIPYQIVRGLEFFQRREVKDLLAYLRLLVNPSDQVALRRVINTPSRGIGQKTVERLFAASEKTGRAIGTVLEEVEGVETLNAGARSRVKAFTEIMAVLRKAASGSAADIMKLAYERSGLAAAHEQEKNEDAQHNVEELINSAVLYEGETPEPSLADYLQQIALISDTDAYDEEAGTVSLMTLHAAKGLEFPAVYIVGLEEGLIPHSRSFHQQKDVEDKNIEEERRLLFVGMTRAKSRLTLGFARNRMAQGTSKAGILTRFLRGVEGIVYESGLEDEGDLSGSEEYEGEADPDYWEAGETLSRGQLVRHPTLGMGRIQRVTSRRDNPRVEIQFLSGVRKTIYLNYVQLDVLD